MEFQRGDKVEVCSQQQGFVGSYYAATVINQLDNNSYEVRYKRLVEEDGTTPLKEVVQGDEIRLRPPIKLSKMAVDSLAMYEEVDAFDNDGWWVGNITGKQGLSYYYVYFDFPYCVEEIYHVSNLRIHQEWVDGKWVTSKKMRY